MECYIFPWIVGGRQCYFKIENLDFFFEILRMSKPAERGVLGVPLAILVVFETTI